MPTDIITASKINRLFDSKNVEIQKILAANVCVALSGYIFSTSLKDYKFESKNTLILLNNKGEVIDEMELDFSTLTTAKKFAEILKAFTRGEDDKHYNACNERSGSD